MNKKILKKWLLKKDIRKLTLDEYYIVLAYLAGGTLIVVFSFLIASLFTFNVDNIVKLLVPFGVLLSAGLASISVMKSINNTNRIEKEKEKKEEEKTLAQLDAILSHLTIKLENTYQSNNIEYLKFEKEYTEKILISLINNEKIMSLNEENLSNLLINIECLVSSLVIASIINSHKVTETPNRVKEYKKEINKIIKILVDKYQLVNSKYSLEAIEELNKS